MTKPEDAVHFLTIGSAKPEWETPQYLFDELNQEFKFNLDVCALPENAKCKMFFSPEDDGLSQEWCGSCWMNPPYGRVIGSWIEKAYKSSQYPEVERVVCLLPVRTDTKWFHNWILPATIRHEAEIRFIKGRLKFSGSTSPAPFPNMLVIFKKNPNNV